MKIVARGNANILIDYGNPVYYYRCCVRYPNSLKENNLYSEKNYKYIEENIRPLLREFLCPMKLEVVPLPFLKKVLETNILVMDDIDVVVIKLPNLKPGKFNLVLYSDHFTKIYSTGDGSMGLMEFKPKWLYDTSRICRNCTHSKYKGRSVDYCYAVIMKDPSRLEELLSSSMILDKETLVSKLISYFKNDQNILRYLFRLQKSSHSQNLASVNHVGDVTDNLLLEMTLKDVTCFLQWDINGQAKCQIIDVDLKPKSKWTHWVQTDRSLSEFKDKVYHH